MNFKNWIILEDIFHTKNIITLLAEGYMDDAATAYTDYIQNKGSWENFNTIALNAAKKVMGAIQYKRRGVVNPEVTDNVVAETMLKLNFLRKQDPHKLPNTNAFKSWFWQIVKNLYWNIVKGKKIDRLTKSSNLSPDDPDYGFKLKQISSRERIRPYAHRNNIPIIKSPQEERPIEDLSGEAKRIFSTLNPQMQQLATLRFLQNKSYQEIADILKVPLSTIKPAMWRLKARLEQVPGLVIPSQKQGEYDPSVPRSQRLYGKKKLG
jgi:RNA polymerase sigma factor (sigma-70 family)